MVLSALLAGIALSSRALLAMPMPSSIRLHALVAELIPEPVRGTLGADILGPENIPLELENKDLLAPPTTDHGEVKNVKWPFSLSHNRLTDGGWSRQQNENDMPIATGLAGVNMRLKAGAIRELHWHKTAEWAYVLKGNVRISTVTPEGRVFIGDAGAGDVWYFPAGNPHSLQAKNTTKEGAEFLLVFNSGAFSEEATFLITDWLAHVPKSVLAKNFGTQNLALFDHIPKHELYIFPSTPPPENLESDMVIPNDTRNPYVYHYSKVKPIQKPGGSVKIMDTRSFKASETICAVEVSVKPGGLRELHWHPTEAEWTYFVEGHARITVFASSGNARTYDYQAGDIAYIPPSFGHYVENIGNGTMKFLEIFNSGLFQDITLTQWLALTPPDLVKAHLGFSESFISTFSKEKQEVV